MASDIVQLLETADRLRKSGAWQEAAQRYANAQKVQPKNPVVAHNLALCHLASGKNEDAILQSSRALSLDAALWQSGLVLAKALIRTKEKEKALQLLQVLHERHPDNPELRLELATITLHQLGDPVTARKLVKPLLTQPVYAREAKLTTLITELYDRDRGLTAEAVNQGFMDFSARYLQLPSGNSTEAAPRKRGPKCKGRPRVGLLSPQFFSSPVYFFAYGALKQLASSVDLVFFHRGSKSDWATEAFRNMACEWMDVSLLGAEQLAARIKGHQLDSLIDLGGWMDPVALLALSGKPARKMYKWVGGQSLTTGLKSFDGFFTDRYQSPRGSEHLFSEPLIRLKSGYVTYTPPSYMPAPHAGQNDELTLGVIANPAKVSRGFMAGLARYHAKWQSRGNRPIRFKFIDYRYQQAAVQERVRQALPQLAIEFVIPAQHADYLAAVSRLDATIDTWPYSGGLTTIESFALGVPAYTRLGELFCERHTTSHCKYAGFDLSQCRIELFDVRMNAFPGGFSLLKPESPRLNHAALANELMAYLN
jgi:predicted O-linked N-acetylglucosamine transferase (SPINDLY family)